MKNSQIISCHGREILDSRGNPTVEATVCLSDGSEAHASVPSGASTGIFEAHELRDNDGSRYNGKGVKNAAYAVESELSPALFGSHASNQWQIDNIILKTDGTENKNRLGANSSLAVSLATAKAAALHFGLPLYRYIGGICAKRLPVPMLNILNGGAHASNNVEIQEFMIVPIGFSSFSDGIRAASEIYHKLGKLISSRGLSTGVGDEGGYAPDLPSDTDALELVCEAILSSGYDLDRVKIALDAAASEWFCENDGLYRMPKRGKVFERSELCGYWEALVRRFPICSLEDGLDQRDFSGWAKLTGMIGDIMLVGDDLFVTNVKRLREGIELGAANAVLVKPNQIGTVSETLALTSAAADAGYKRIMSHRSGETEDTALADLAVGVGAEFIKTGAPCRGERTAKYNRLTAIEAELGESAVYRSF